MQIQRSLTFRRRHRAQPMRRNVAPTARRQRGNPRSFNLLHYSTRAAERSNTGRRHGAGSRDSALDKILADVLNSTLVHSSRLRSAAQEDAPVSAQTAEESLY